MADTEPDVCAASCEAILAFLCDNDCIARSGGLSDFPAAPPVTCDATPLAGVHEVMPPHAGDKCRAETLMPVPPPLLNRVLKGVVSFMVGIGARVQQGQPLFQVYRLRVQSLVLLLIVEFQVCDPVSDRLSTVCSPADGCMYNRERLRFAQPGLWICKVKHGV